MSDEQPFPEDSKFEAPLAISSLVGSLMQMQIVAEKNESTDFFNPQCVLLPKDKEQRETFAKLIGHLVKGLVEMTTMPPEVLDDLKKEVALTAKMRLQDRGTYDERALRDILKAAGFTGKVDESEEVEYDDEDLSWMEGHPRFRKN